MNILGYLTRSIGVRNNVLVGVNELHDGPTWITLTFRSLADFKGCACVLLREDRNYLWTEYRNKGIYVTNRWCWCQRVEYT